MVENDELLVIMSGKQPMIKLLPRSAISSTDGSDDTEIIKIPETKGGIIQRLLIPMCRSVCHSVCLSVCLSVFVQGLSACNSHLSPGVHMFHTGTTKAGGHSLLCVANKRRVIIYEFTKIKGVSGSTSTSTSTSTC